MKKVLSVFLAVVMLLSVTAGIDFSAQAKTTVVTGNCSYDQSVKYSFDKSTGKMTISGSGEMKDYTGGSHWSKYNIKSVVIKSGVTSIGDYAFYNCENLTKVTIPDTVKSIGTRAFYGCSSLKSLTIPNGVKSIYSYAFAYCKSLSSVSIPKSVSYVEEAMFKGCDKLKTAGGANSDCNIKFALTSLKENLFSYCTSLTSVTIPSTVTNISAYAFKGCSGLKKISIPKSVTSISSGAFNDCKSLTSISVSKKNKKYASVNGNLFNKDKTTLIQYAVGKTNESYTVPKTVTKIAYAALADSKNLSSVTLPSKLKTISSFGLAGSSITGVKLPSSLTALGENAFYRCSSLKSISIPNKVKTINISTFAYCSNLEKVSIGDGVKTIDWCAFYYCSSLKNIDFGNSVEVITDAFKGCKKLSKISLPSSVKEIDDYAFVDLTGLKTLEIKSGTIGEGAFADCTNLTTVTLGNKVKSIDVYAFVNCENLKEIKIPDSVETVGSNAFAGCKGLVSADVGATVTRVVYDTFAECSKLSEVRVLNPKAVIDDKKSTIPSGVTIYGYKNSTAQTYAKKYNRKFVSLIDASNYIIELSKTSFVYDGKTKHPKVTVKTNKGKVVSSDYYDVAYEPSSTKVGTYRVTVTFKHQYVGTLKKKYSIKPKSTSVSNITAKSKAFTVSWKKVTKQTTGYEIQYATNSKFTKNKKVVTVSKNSTTSKTISSLKAKKKYYVRVRTYKTVDGKKIYSAWSKTKTVTTK